MNPSLAFIPSDELYRLLTVPLGIVFSSGLSVFHCASCVILAALLARKAAARGRSRGYALLGPLFWGFNAVMFWSLAGADIGAMGVIGGLCGGALAWIFVTTLEPETSPEESSSPASESSASSPEAPSGPLLCPSCGAQGAYRGDMLLCSNTSCNSEFFAFEAKAG